MSVQDRTNRRGVLAAAGAAMLSAALPVRAQSGYPNRPIRMIVPLAAGSAVDVAARLLAQKMAVNMGQPITVENLVGAAGIIGAAQLQKAAPDGYTIGGFNDSILTMVPNMNPATPFNPMTDFAHISQVATVEFGIAVPSTSPYKTAAEFIAAAKASPGKLSYASGGNGSPQHLAGALFAAHTGIDIRHVPYRGASQAAQDTASGQTDVTLQGIATVASLVKAGKLRLIGVMGGNRQAEYPTVPTLAEQGISGFDFSTWFALTAPPGTPRDIVTRLHRESVRALGDPEIKERYAGLGLRPNGGSPEQLTALIREQLARYGKAIKDNNIKGE
ncbi:MAG TPA: tripartite tricarboxylate transporter substrate binding protein [Ramlibacter sp.]|jgi:tripartite-type tricarboxylate transporter receptor subunit TctC|nr:tripartite tricarboxylate transporter substrate binding protein [Ramlibacter sp.]